MFKKAIIKDLNLFICTYVINDLENNRTTDRQDIEKYGQTWNHHN